jgi:ribosomal-protein-alanine N-acetyltransferase
VNVVLAYPDPPLTDGIVTLRAWTEADLPLIAEVSRDPHIPEITTVPSPYGEESGREWLERQWGRATNDEGLSLAIADSESDEPLGALALLRRRVGSSGVGTSELGYWIVDRARGRGLATRAVRLLVHWALMQRDVARVEAFAEPWNLASQRVLERVGFTREGFLRSYLCFPNRRADALIYSLLPEDLR